MSRRMRMAAQSACLLAGTLAILSLALAHLGEASFVVGTVVTGTATYTAMDALAPDARPRDAAWLRRRITGNLVYVAIAAFVIVIVVG